MPTTQQALILDLDNTIFETRSMDAAIFQPFFSELAHQLSADFGKETIDRIMDDLWSKTWDEVMARYGIPQETILRAAHRLENLDIRAEAFPDYGVIEAMDCPKYLVTTSITGLQESKIDALNIRGDFEKIYIHDPFKKSKTKLEAFQALMEEYGLRPESTYVVGDNCDSEIKAGNSLNMVTVQILRTGVTKGSNAKHYIHSFHELPAIMDHNKLSN